jgi:hypothetical protein
MSPARFSFAFQLAWLLVLLAPGCGADEANKEPSDGDPVQLPDSGALSDAAGTPGGGTAGGSDASGGATGGGATGGGTTGGGTTGGGATGGGAAGGLDAGGGSDGGSNPGRDAGADAAPTPQDASSSDAAVGDAGGLAKFSFFVTSEAAIRDLSKDPEGFGGDLRFGETGAGAGLRGADKICGEIAERSMPGARAKQWRAFLSAASGGEGGGAVNARDRIGQGPWYDRKGRLVGNSLADLINGTRPSMADVQIRNDLPNETGTGNHAPDGNQVDNHDTLTGSDANGRFVSGTNTCMDWTSTANSSGGGGGGGGGSGPPIGHSWPRSTGGGGGGGAGANWISDHRAGGCGKGINTMNGTTDGTATVGAGGGYGGFYCFALTP